MLVRTMGILSRSLGRRAFVGYPTPWKSSVSGNYRIVARVAMTERERAYRCDFMRQFRERRMPDMFLELSFSRGVHFHTISFTCGGSQWLRSIKAPKTIHQQLTHHHREAAEHHESGAHEGGASCPHGMAMRSQKFLVIIMGS
jgi:hypothetical protein